jgi:hypothetical protein
VETEPILAEKPAEPIPASTPVPGGVEPATATPVLAEIAEPVLIDELTSSPAAHPPHPEVEEHHAHAHHSEVEEHHAHAPHAAIDPEWVHVIVQKAVVKMSPPALAPEVVDELIRTLTEEIAAELNAEPPHTH